MRKFFKKIKASAVKVKEFVMRKLRKSTTKPIDEDPISDIIKDLIANGSVEFEPGQTAITPMQFMTIFDAMTGGVSPNFGFDSPNFGF